MDFTFNGKDYLARYKTFRVADEADNYRLSISGYSGNAGDSMSYHNGYLFCTIDRDNDGHLYSNCAEEYGKGGWWYKDCHEVNFNGIWGDKTYHNGLNWKKITGYYASATSTEMKIR